MFKQIWISDKIEPWSYATIFPDIVYYPDETWKDGANILHTNILVTVAAQHYDTDFHVVAMVLVNQKQWPSWSIGYIFINGETGKNPLYLPAQLIAEMLGLSSNQWVTANEATESAAGVIYGSVSSGADALELAWKFATLDEIKERIIAGLEKLGDGVYTPDIEDIEVNLSLYSRIGLLNLTGNSLLASKYGSPIALRRVFVDEYNDRLMRPYDSGIPIVKVYELASGDFVQDIWVSGDPEQIFAESNRHAYVYCRNGMLDLINYIDGRVVSSYRAPFPPDTEYIANGVGQQTFCYERRLRRLISMTNTAREDIEGVSHSTVRARGYYPVPLPVGLSTPIPLKPLRKGKKIPVVVRLHGDILEPISGVNVSATVDGAGELTITNGITNALGEVVLQVIGDTSELVTLTATATIADNEAI